MAEHIIFRIKDTNEKRGGECGVKHEGASMMTSEVAGAFADHTKTAKAEVMAMIEQKL